MNSRTHVGIRALAFAAAMLAVGCTPKAEDPLPPPPAATITTFTVSPSSVAKPGDMVTITWATENATGISLEQVGAGPVSGATATSGSATVAVQASTVFVLTARGEGGTDARSAGVSLATQSGSVLFSALPPEVLAGQSTNLVWYAPGAQAVTLTEVGGSAVDIGTQLDSGVVTVTPTVSTTYRLTVDGKDFDVAVTVAPVIAEFALDGPAPAPGDMVKLKWTTRGASSLTLTRVGEANPVLSETDPATVASGTFSEALPADLPVDGVLQYRLSITNGTTSTERPLTIRVGGSLTLAVTAAQYAVPSSQVSVQWTTTNATSLTVSVDGVVQFVAASQAEVAAGTLPIPTPASGSVSVEFVARNERNDEQRRTVSIATVGTAHLNSFTSDLSTIAAGGEKVTLSWDVTNARHVRIREVGGRFSKELFGETVGTGTVAVYPNRATTTYELVADNQTTEPPLAPQTLDVTVTTPAVLTFSAPVPAGAAVQLTGSTVAGGGSLHAPDAILPTTGQWIDISATGTSTSCSSSCPDLADLGPWTLPLLGNTIDASKVSISPNGWFVFSQSSVTGPDTDLTSFGTSLPALAIAPFMRNLSEASDGETYWQVDTLPTGKRLVIQWMNSQLQTDSTTRVNFEAQVYSDGRIVFAYQNFQGIAPDSGLVGINNPTQTGAVLPSVPPSAGGFLAIDPAVLGDAVTLPLDLTASTSPLIYLQQMADGYIEVTGTSAIAPGLFAIVEVNPRPAAGITDGQWLEIANFTSQPVDLTGWSIQFSTTSSFPIPAGTTLPANGRLLFAQAADLGDATAGITADVVYGNTYALAASGNVQLAYGPGTYGRIAWPTLTAGRSWQADAPNSALRLASTYPTASCPGSGTYGTQTGSPGAAHPKCFPYVLEPLPPNGFQSIASTGTTLVLASNLTTFTTYQVTLPQAVSAFGNASTHLSVCSAGWVSLATTTSTGTSNKSTPSTSTPVGTIAPFWDYNAADTALPTNGLYWEQRDPDMTPGSGDELTIVSWEGFRYSSTSYAGQYADWQVIFHGNGDIDFQYGQQVGTTTYLKGSSATSWIEQPAGTSALAVNVNSTTAPGITAFTGFRYRYVP